MKIRIDVDESNTEELIIKCKKITDEITSIQNLLKNDSKKIIFYKDNIEYYLELSKILFFETDGNIVNAHTIDNVFQTKYKLYELEKLLPSSFMRVSKSTILSIDHIYSISRNITSSSVVEFNNTYKKVYVSRLYYKVLREKMEGRFLYER